jgi:hypothetical protein
VKKYLVFLAAALVQAGAWAATYTYAGAPYTAAAITNYSNCTAGACANFTAAMAQSGSFSTVAPLPANLNNADIASLITSFSFSDGLSQYNSADPDTTLVGAQASTNASGGVLAIELSFQHWADNSPHVLGSRMDVMILRLLARKNSQCQGVVFQSPSGREVCQHVDFDAASSRVTFSAPVVPGAWTVTGLPPAAANAVPALGDWAAPCLACVLAGTGWWMTQRRSFRRGGTGLR